MSILLYIIKPDILKHNIPFIYHRSISIHNQPLSKVWRCYQKRKIPMPQKKRVDDPRKMPISKVITCLHRRTLHDHLLVSYMKTFELFKRCMETISLKSQVTSEGETVLTCLFFFFCRYQLINSVQILFMAA